AKRGRRRRDHRDVRGARALGLGARECGVVAAACELGGERVAAKRALEAIRGAGALGGVRARARERERGLRIEALVAQREPAARERPAIAIVLACAQRVDVDLPGVAVAGLGERDPRADLSVRVAALDADRERFAVAALGAGFVAEPAARIA